MPDYAKLCHAGTQAVTLASAVCREVQASLEQLKAITKDDKSPVTVADFASQAIVAKVLKDHLGPDVILVGEEDSKFLREPDHATHLTATLAAVQTVWPDATEETLLQSIDVGAGDTHHAGFWTLDPVDGTKGFLRNQQYAIALAYVERGTPTVGIMGCPNLPSDFSKPLDKPDKHGCIYAAIKGDGVYAHHADNRGEKPIQIRRPDHEEGQPISVCASVEKAHSNVSDTDRILEYLSDNGIPAGEPTRLDSQAKYAVTARGQADAYLRLPTKKGYVERIWDHAAGSLVATEAGCFVTDIHGNALDFSHGRGLEKNRGIVCAPPRVHGHVIGAIKQLGIGADA
ncbi:MAG: 3'(2'),5'-bisphosphate nucleotidase [Phycisphaerales bacterium JB054]